MRYVRQRQATASRQRENACSSPALETKPREQRPAVALAVKLGV